MASDVQICNIGLSYIGLGGINSLTEDSPEARVCNLHFAHERDMLLEDFSYRFATGRQALALQSVNDREEEWVYRYARPTGILKMRWVQDINVVRTLRARGEDISAPYQMAEGFVYTDIEDAWCEFTNSETNPNEFPPFFQDALSWGIAKSAAVSITEVQDRLEFAGAMYVRAKEKAEMSALADEPQDSTVTADWLRERGFDRNREVGSRFGDFGLGPY